MSNENKSQCLTYPGQPDNVTPDELVQYFHELAEVEAQKRRDAIRRAALGS